MDGIRAILLMAVLVAGGQVRGHVIESVRLRRGLHEVYIITDLYSDIAAELRARDLYMHLANIVPDAGSRDTLIFLGNREEAHAAAFARALESIKGTVELPREWFTHPYINASPGSYQQFLDMYAPVPAPPPLTYPPQYPYPYPVQLPAHRAE